jgi:hypothetical protein
VVGFVEGLGVGFVVGLGEGLGVGSGEGLEDIECTPIEGANLASTARLGIMGNSLSLLRSVKLK